MTRGIPIGGVPHELADCDGVEMGEERLLSVGQRGAQTARRQQRAIGAHAIHDLPRFELAQDRPHRLLQRPIGQVDAAVAPLHGHDQVEFDQTGHDLGDVRPRRIELVGHRPRGELLPPFTGRHPHDDPQTQVGEHRELHAHHNLSTAGGGGSPPARTAHEIRVPDSTQ